jgi:hypothetical protein
LASNAASTPESLLAITMNDSVAYSLLDVEINRHMSQASRPKGSEHVTNSVSRHQTVKEERGPVRGTES